MLYEGDCLDIMPTLPDKSIDMILCDLPYGTTACKWDTVIPFEPLWKEYKRLIKDNGAIVLTASQPFTSALVMSNPKWFKYEWVWDKVQSTGFLNAKKRPLPSHEDICVFSGVPLGRSNYFPQMTKGLYRDKSPSHSTDKVSGRAYGVVNNQKSNFNDDYYPKTIIKISNACQIGKVHPTQKPVALFEYLIKTYTNEGDTVLDNCAGSGTTGVACINTNRKYILIEKDKGYCEIIKNRITNTQVPLLAVN